MNPVERQRQTAQNPTSKTFFKFSKVVVGTLSGPHGSQFGPHGSPTVLATKNGQKDTAVKSAPITAETAFFKLFCMGFWGPFWVPTVLKFPPTVLPRFSGKSPRFSHGSPENPHGSPTVLRKIPTVLPRFSHGSAFLLRPNHCFLEPESPRFSHGSPTVLCKVPTVLPRFFVKSPRFSHGSL